MGKPTRKLKIAQIAPIIERIPPKKYGGIERVIHSLTEELVKRGHDVTLFASGDSITSAKLISVYPRSLREIKTKDLYHLNELEVLHIGHAYNMQKEFDIIHDHHNRVNIIAAHFSATPVVITVHGNISNTGKKIFSEFNNPCYVAISKSQARLMPKVKIVDTIYNGLPFENASFKEQPGKYLLYVGRISFEKGLHLAIDAANKLNLPLIIAAKLDEAEPRDVEYFHQYIEKRLDHKQVKWIGEVNEKKRNSLMSNALCFLHPIIWPEPFGLTLIEALACGCPVIAFNKGSVPEIIANGKTGFIVHDAEEMIDAVKKVNGIDRTYCRRYALLNFNEKIMTDKYEALYNRLIF